MSIPPFSFVTTSGKRCINASPNNAPAAKLTRNLTAACKKILLHARVRTPTSDIRLMNMTLKIVYKTVLPMVLVMVSHTQVLLKSSQDCFFLVILNFCSAHRPAEYLYCFTISGPIYWVRGTVFSAVSKAVAHGGGGG